jgi:hypothetical protein
VVGDIARAGLERVVVMRYNHVMAFFMKGQ